jgi:hypothetical protein
MEVVQNVIQGFQVTGIECNTEPGLPYCIKMNLNIVF